MMDPRLVTPFLIAALVLWSLYRRTRRSFGRQTIHAGRLWLRIGILALVGGLVLVASVRDTRMLAALVAGLCTRALSTAGYESRVERR